MKQYVLLLFLNLSLISFSQEPFGKRFSITASQGFSMVDYISTKFVGHNRISLNCVFGKHFMVGIDANYGYAKYGTNSYYNNWTAAPEIDDKSVGLSFYYFRAREGGMAPSGRYFFGSVSYGVSNKLVSYSDTIGTGWNPVIIYYPTLNEASVRKSLIFNLGFGRNFIIHRRMILGYSLDFGFDTYGSSNEPFNNRYIMRPSIKIGYTF